MEENWTEGVGEVDWGIGGEAYGGGSMKASEVDLKALKGGGNLHYT